jgi:hypothetical protein
MRLYTIHYQYSVSARKHAADFTALLLTSGMRHECAAQPGESDLWSCAHHSDSTVTIPCKLLVGFLVGDKKRG